MAWSPCCPLPFLVCLRVSSRAPACARSFCGSRDSGALLGKVLAQAGPPEGGEDPERSAGGERMWNMGQGRNRPP